MPVDHSQLTALSKDAQGAPTRTRKQALDTLRGASFAVERRVKSEMPVDTGRARASWGHWTPGDVRNWAANASADDVIWREEDGGFTIVQGSNVPYMEMLNNGHSRQAPAGFIDRAQLTGQLELEKALGLIDPLDPNLGWL
jgi:hypothetical protein